MAGSTSFVTLGDQTGNTLCLGGNTVLIPCWGRSLSLHNHIIHFQMFCAFKISNLEYRPYLHGTASCTACCDMANCGTACCGMANCGTACCGMANCDTACCGMACCGMANCDMAVWHAVIWHAVVQHAVVWQTVTRHSVVWHAH